MRLCPLIPMNRSFCRKDGALQYVRPAAHDEKGGCTKGTLLYVNSPSHDVSKEILREIDEVRSHFELFGLHTRGQGKVRSCALDGLQG